MGIEAFHLGGAFTHLLALVLGFISLHRYSRVWTNPIWGDVDYDYIALAISICMNVLIIGLLFSYATSAPPAHLNPTYDLLFALYHTATGLIVAYWHYSVRVKYDERLKNTKESG